jgi:hypothetical protein
MRLDARLASGSPDSWQLVVFFTCTCLYAVGQGSPCDIGIGRAEPPGQRFASNPSAVFTRQTNAIDDS